MLQHLPAFIPSLASGYILTVDVKGFVALGKKNTRTHTRARARGKTPPDE